MKLKRFTIIILAAVLLSFTAIAAACGNGEFPDGEYFYVSLSVNASAALRSDNLSQEVRDVLPEDGYILQTRQIRITRRTTVLTLLRDELTQEEISFIIRRGYVAEIGGLNEKAIGTQSGWIFFINGEFASLGAGSTVVQADDIIEWRYTASFGDNGQ